MIIERLGLLMINLTCYKLQLVKDTSARYDFKSRKISSPESAVHIIKEVFEMDAQCEEIMVLIALNTKNNIVGCFEVSRGSLNSSIVHPREIFKRAIAINAASIILGHNHPSGDPAPSGEDINTTNRIKECGKILGIDVLDHVIIGENSYVSLKERGVL